MTTRRELERLLGARIGIDFARGGVGRSLDRFLERRQRELGSRSLADYVALLDRPDSRELELLLDAITVVHSWFFRDPGQLAAIELLLSQTPPKPGPSQIWIGGCACGEDVYSIALLAQRAGRPVQILGTDLNTQALAQAAIGEYGRWSVRDVPPALRQFFTPAERGFRVDEPLRRDVRFERRNLLDAPPAPAVSGGWDIIVCRNVLIYFERDKARQVFERQAAALAPGGHLLLGASEVVFDVPNELEPVYVAGRLVFRRVLKSQPGSAPAGAPGVGPGALPAPGPAASPFRAPGALPIARQTAPPKPLIVAHRTPGCASPLPALPRAVAALDVDPPDRPSERRLKVENEDPLAQGHALLDGGDPRAARDAYLEVVARDGTFAQAHMYTGIAEYLCGNVDRSLHHLRAALFLDGALWPAAFYLALCYENMALPTEAYREYENVIRLCERQESQGATWHPSLSDWRRDLLALARQRVGSGAVAPSARRTRDRR